MSRARGDRRSCRRPRGASRRPRRRRRRARRARREGRARPRGAGARARAGRSGGTRPGVAPSAGRRRRGTRARAPAGARASPAGSPPGARRRARCGPGGGRRRRPRSARASPCRRRELERERQAVGALAEREPLVAPCERPPGALGERLSPSRASAFGEPKRLLAPPTSRSPVTAGESPGVDAWLTTARDALASASGVPAGELEVDASTGTTLLDSRGSPRTRAATAGTRRCSRSSSAARPQPGPAGVEELAAPCGARSNRPSGRSLGGHGRAADRHGHLPVHRHRGLDAAAPRARRARTPRALERSPAPAREAFAGTAASRSAPQGDAFFVAFARARDGARGRRGRPARARRARLARRHAAPRPDRRAHGRGRRRGDGYVGLDVHRAAPDLPRGHGGQVLCRSDRRARRRTTSGRRRCATSASTGSRTWPQPQRLYQLVVDGLRDAFPPLRTLGERPTNLPAQPTPLIGREREVAALTSCCAGADVRCVTLTGPGGTEDAARAAARGRADRGFPDGRVRRRRSPRSRRRARRCRRSRRRSASSEQPGQPLEARSRDYLARQADAARARQLRAGARRGADAGAAARRGPA